MNFKLITALLVVAIIIVGVWYWYATLLSTGQYGYGPPTTNQNATTSDRSSFDTTADISSDFSRVPNDSLVDDSVELIENNVSKF